MTPRKFVFIALMISLVLGASFLAIWNPLEVRWIPRCPFKTLTGYDCPGCGTLRATHQLFHGNWAAALRLNWMAVILGPVTVIWLTLETLASLGRLPQSWNYETRSLRFSVCIGWWLLGITLCWWFIRNIPAFRIS